MNDENVMDAAVGSFYDIFFKYIVQFNPYTRNKPRYGSLLKQTRNFSKKVAPKNGSISWEDYVEFTKLGIQSKALSEKVYPDYISNCENIIHVISYRFGIL